MQCIQPDICNCVSACTCGRGYECCSQTIPQGKKPTFGMCVKQGSCDTDKGLPKTGCRDTPQQQQQQLLSASDPQPSSLVRLAVVSIEGFSFDSLITPKSLAYVIAGIVCIAVILSLCMYCARRKRK